MKKMPCVFVREFHDRGSFTITDQVTPGCEWVLEGLGVPSRKWDGTACLIRGMRIYARYDCKKGKEPPSNWEPCQPERDPVTGHWPGWVLVEDQPQYKWHRKTFDAYVAWAVERGVSLADGTYELIGEKINNNNERFEGHQLARHGDYPVYGLGDPPFTFEFMRDFLGMYPGEGIVFRHPDDGRMAKIRRRDFGFDWPFARWSPGGK